MNAHSTIMATCKKCCQPIRLTKILNGIHSETSHLIYNLKCSVTHAAKLMLKTIRSKWTKWIKIYRLQGSSSTELFFIFSLKPSYKNQALDCIKFKVHWQFWWLDNFWFTFHVTKGNNLVSDHSPIIFYFKDKWDHPDTKCWWKQMEKLNGV